jgi:hypothetical protein
LIQIDPVHTTPPYFFTIRFNITLIFKSTSSQLFRDKITSSIIMRNINKRTSRGLSQGRKPSIRLG